MNQRLINIIFGVGIIFAIVLLLLQSNETPPQIPTIDYEKYEQRFNEINMRFERQDSLDLAQDTVIQSMKLTIVTDEKTIRNATNSDIDSIFNAMVARQRKSILQ